MDLSLIGSQVNLATRERGQPKHLQQKSVHYPNNLRPRSASYQFKRSSCSPTPFLHRPQSADPKFERTGYGSLFSGNYNNIIKNTLNHKRFKSISSSSILKLLLEEPISRICSTNGSSSELNFESNALRKASKANQRKSNSVDVSVIHDETNQKSLSPISHKKNYKSNGKKMLASGNKVQGVASQKLLSQNTSTNTSRKPNFEISCSLNNSNFEKTDLPGRVSFFKADMANDLDYSDSENDKHDYQNINSTTKSKQEEGSISAPGPLIFPNYKTNNDLDAKEANKINSKDSISEDERLIFSNYRPTDFVNKSHDSHEKEASNTCSKKTVHFGNSGNESVLAETYFYTNIASENCSGSTHSSSSGSIPESLDIKCSCCVHKAKKDTSLISPSKEIEEIKDPGSENNNFEKKLHQDRLKNFEFDFQFKDKETLNAENKFGDLPSNDDKKRCELSEVEREKSLVQNNFSGMKNHYVNLNAPHSVISEITKVRKDIEKNSNNKQTDESYNSTSDNVINNYLTVTSSAAVMYKKEIYQNKKLPTYSDKKFSTELAKTKKILRTSREESNLTEFRLDEIESWISVHDANESVTEDKVNDKEIKENNNDNLRTEEHNDTASQVSNKSEDQEDFTYDDIVSVIKEIEEDKKKDNLAEKVCNEMELKLNSSAHDCENAAKETLGKAETPDKYKDILNYLDEIDDSCDKALLETRRSLPDSSRSEIEFVVEPDITEDVPKLQDLLLLPNHQLARRVITLSLRANELANALYLSKEHVSKVRHEKQKAVRLEKANSSSRLRELKKHYEDAVKRHQGFIEQLLKDKGSLCEKIAALTRRLESQNTAWEHKMETEVARAKETTLAGEKIKRERWVRENTKRIKELTVKGLEAEINKMNAAHQLEIRELKRMHQEQLLNALEEARQKHEQIENSIRESSAQDREMILEKERTAIRQRFERQMEQERKSFDDQKAKMCADFNAERERLENELKAKDVDFQLKRQEILREKQHEMEVAISELQNKMSKQDEKYQNRINTIEKQFETDFEIWKRDFENEYKMLNVEKENIIRQHYREERDKQIDEIVQRMDAEALKNAEEHEAKIARLKQKYESDLQTLEKTEKLLTDKFNETRSKLAESDAQVKNFEAEIKQLHIELEHTKKMCNDTAAERDQLRENLRNEIKNEVASLKYERDIEIEKIHKRVQQAIEKKNVTIELLQKENSVLRERCLKLEAVIRQQRKDYCAK